MINLQGSLGVWVWQLHRDVLLNASRNRSSWCHRSCNLLQMWLSTNNNEKKKKKGNPGGGRREPHVLGWKDHPVIFRWVRELVNDIIPRVCQSVGRRQWVRAQRAEVWSQRESPGRAARRLCERLRRLPRRCQVAMSSGLVGSTMRLNETQDLCQILRKLR